MDSSAQKDRNKLIQNVVLITGVEILIMIVIIVVLVEINVLIIQSAKEEKIIQLN